MFFFLVLMMNTMAMLSSRGHSAVSVIVHLYFLKHIANTNKFRGDVLFTQHTAKYGTFKALYIKDTCMLNCYSIIH